MPATATHQRQIFNRIYSAAYLNALHAIYHRITLHSVRGHLLRLIIRGKIYNKLLPRLFVLKCDALKFKILLRAKKRYAA